MTPIEIIVWTAAAVATAVILEWLIRRADRGVQIDTQRVEAAETALSQHREAVESLLRNEMLDDEMRRFVLGYASAVIRRDIACTIVDMIVEHRVERYDVSEDAKAFEGRLADLQRRAPEAHSLLMHAVRSGLLASVLQWPESTKRLADVVVRLGSQLENEAAGAAVYVERKAKAHDVPYVRDLEPAF